MKQKTSMLFTNPYKVIKDEETAALFFNEDGTEPMGNIYFPRVPVVLEQTGKHIQTVWASFTTVEDFLEDPPEFLQSYLNGLRESEGELTITQIRYAFYTYEYWGTHNVYFTVFNDNTLVYTFLPVDNDEEE